MPCVLMPECSFFGLERGGGAVRHRGRLVRLVQTEARQPGFVVRRCGAVFNMLVGHLRARHLPDEARLPDERPHVD